MRFDARVRALQGGRHIEWFLHGRGLVGLDGDIVGNGDRVGYGDGDRLQLGRIGRVGDLERRRELQRRYRRSDHDIFIERRQRKHDRIERLWWIQRIDRIERSGELHVEWIERGRELERGCQLLLERIEQRILLFLEFLERGLLVLLERRRNVRPGHDDHDVGDGLRDHGAAGRAVRDGYLDGPGVDDQ
jgi:hypothetical protein